MDLRGSIPTFVHLTDGHVYYLKVMDKISIVPYAFYLMMYRGYVKFDGINKNFHPKNASLSPGQMTTWYMRYWE